MEKNWEGLALLLLIGVAIIAVLTFIVTGKAGMPHNIPAPPKVDTLEISRVLYYQNMVMLYQRLDGEEIKVIEQEANIIRHGNNRRDRASLIDQINKCNKIQDSIKNLLTAP